MSVMKQVSRGARDGAVAVSFSADRWSSGPTPGKEPDDAWCRKPIRPIFVQNSTFDKTRALDATIRTDPDDVAPRLDQKSAVHRA